MTAAATQASPAPDHVDALVQLSDITVRFAGITALDGVDFDLGVGEVRALLGENGAGKSTLGKVLAGAIRPSSGKVSVAGEELDFTPMTAIRAGVRIISQEMSLYPPLTVAENLVTGGFGHSERIVRWRRARTIAQEHLDRLGLSIDARAKIADLSIAEQQMIEIARALFSGGRIVVLDEPTSALGVAEADRLFDFVSRMCDDGTSFVLITHFLDDVMAHSHTATVLRNGKVAGHRITAETTKESLVQLMVGDSRRRSTTTGAECRLKPVPAGRPYLTITNCGALPRVKDMSLEVHPGEVVGLFGDMGSGSVELAEIAFGIRNHRTGAVFVAGQAVRSAEHSVRHLGSAYIPQDRRDALALGQSAAANVTLAQLHNLVGLRLSKSRETSITNDQIAQLSVKSCRPKTLPGTLSGGNQQKLLFARCLVRAPRLMILVEPTRGMDVGAKDEVARLIRQTADTSGTAILVVSAEPESVLAVADRVYVAQQGRIRAHLHDMSASSSALMSAAHLGETEITA
ncbi:sugar ABC transporter ATP-binding protein [Amycolatopsis thermoflava]|uniref:sugar ABC transporter ATP-binding protein n=1 Tax=Amycolatopsis thermoflava TaxID=84480 RepID=UPI0004196F3F|nr:sugar ABC transporter ATP-binding protein [Amycolatopsis thermoflava]